MTGPLFLLLLVVAAVAFLPFRNRWHRFLAGTIEKSGSFGLVLFAVVLAGIGLVLGPPQDRWVFGLAGFLVLVALIIRPRPDAD